MKAWLENPKNKLIVMIVCPIIMIAAIVLVLLNLGVIHTGNSTATPPPNIAGSAGPMPGPGSPIANVPPGATPPGSTPPGSPAATPAPGPPAKPNGAQKVAAASKTKTKTALATKKPTKVAAKPAPKPKPVQVAAAPPAPGGPGASTAAAAPTSTWQGVPPPKLIRSDPFKPYRNLALIRMASAPTLPTLPTVQIASQLVNPVGAPGAPGTPGGQNGPSQQTGPPPPALAAGPPPPIPWKVAGIMTGGAGVKAIVVNGDQSTIIQPGDTLPDSTVQVTDISATGVTVRVNNQDVKLAPQTDTTPGGDQPQPGQPDIPQPQPQ